MVGSYQHTISWPDTFLTPLTYSSISLHYSMFGAAVEFKQGIRLQRSASVDEFFQHG